MGRLMGISDDLMTVKKEMAKNEDGNVYKLLWRLGSFERKEDRNERQIK
jgi:hypothetical protein